MKECLKYYKLPLHDNYPCIFCNDGAMAFTWIGRLEEATRKSVIQKMNGESSVKFKYKVFYEDGKICFKSDTGLTHTLLLVRGWGHLIGTGGYNLPPKKAAQIQDEFAEYVVEQINK